MSIVPVDSATPPKRRKKIQRKARRSRGNSRSKGDATGGVSLCEERTTPECWERQLSHASGDQSDDKSVKRTASIPIRSVPPTSNASQPSREISALDPNVAVVELSENFFPLDGRCSPLIKTGEECFALDKQEDMLQIQPQIDAVSQMYLENSTIGDALQYERLQALKSEEEPSLMEYPSSTASPFFSFGCSSTASSPESAFSFSPEVDTNMAVADFSEHWSSPNYSSVLMSQIGTDQAYTRSPQPIFCTDFGRNTMSWLVEDPSDGVDIILGSSFHDKFQAQDHQKKGETKPSTDNRSAQAECGSTISTILPSASTPQPGKSRGKRSLPGDSTDDGGDQSQPTNCGRVPRDSGGEKPLACPFHKKDPQQYQDCGKYLLRRIKDVKQHIYRLHCKPELNCPRCFQNFKCADERDHHIRKGGCTLKDVPILDSIISEEQKKKLKDCGSRGTSKHQQWMELWSVIFPGAKPPRSPHIDNGQEELLSCLRSYWDENATEIIAKSLGENDLESPNFTGIREVVDSILNHFEAKPTDWDLKNNGKTGVAPQPSPVHGVTVEDTPNHLSLQDPDQLSEIDFASYTLTANSPDSFSPDDWASPIAMG